MPGREPLALPFEIVYLYDGGLEGFYTCVHESVYSRQLPLDIQPESEAQPTLLPLRFVETSPEKARKVRAGVEKKLTVRTRELVETVFLTCLPRKELAILRFLLLSFRDGPRTINRPDHPDVAPLLQAERQIFHEAHLYTGFVRFSDCGGRLISAIRPKNFVLPYIAGHFMERFYQEDFMIYDKTHGAALLYQQGRGEIVQVVSFEPPEDSETEIRYQELWKKFYETLAIETRYNPKCRMTHLPKRYWSEMTEMRRYL